MYPLKLKPVYKTTIWGGNKLRDVFGKESGLENVGEAWELAYHKNGVCEVANGEYKGLTIGEIFSKYGEEVIGRKIKDLGKYPLLLKLIDAKGLLSIQVHPSDDYAKKHENGSLGKTEAWYILDADDGAFLYVGFKKGVTKELLEERLKAGGKSVLELFNKVYVKAGDVINIEAGLLHAIGEGIMLLEIQENSDITYRVYDYDRVDKDGNKRELHVKKALDVLRFDMEEVPLTKGEVTDFDWGKHYDYISNEYFKLQKIEVKSEFEFQNEDYSVLTCISGSYNMKYEDEILEVKKGETVIVPKVMESVVIEPKKDCKIIIIGE